jgi:predicted membrane protein
MNEIPRNRNLGKLIFGLSVLAFGVLFLLGNLKMIESSDYLRYWPVILIAFGLSKLLQPRESGGRMFGFILGLAGVLLLLSELGKIHFTLWDFWPVVLVLLGLSIIWGALGHRSGRHRSWRERHRVFVTVNGEPMPRQEPMSRQVDADAIIEVNNILGGTERIVTSQDFRGGSISTIMGGCEIDFREASISGGEAALDVSVVFGGVEIRVPEDWKVVTRANAILGGVEDKSRKPVSGGSKTLTITGNVIFGGLEIRN